MLNAIYDAMDLYDIIPLAQLPSGKSHCSQLVLVVSLPMEGG